MSQRLLFFVYAVSILLIPPVTVLALKGSLAPFWFLAGDAYLYLGIGNASDGWTFSFDGLRPTNGFHPLWQLWVRMVSEILNDPQCVMAVVAGSAIVFSLMGTLALGVAIQRLTDSWLLAAIAVPGVFYLFFGQGFRTLSPWAFFDGMEVALAYALAGVLALQISRLNAEQNNPKVWFRIGIVLAFLVLTRLDEVFVAVCIALSVLCWPNGASRKRLQHSFLVLAPVSVALGAYFIWSIATTGLLLPISGAAKGEGAFISNTWVSLVTFFAPAIDIREAFTSWHANRESLFGAGFRVVQLLIPAAFAAISSIMIWKYFRQEAWAPVVVGLCGGVVVKTIYNFVFVSYWHQAGWYFGVATMTVTLTTVLIVAPGLAAVQRRVGEASLILVGLLVSFALLHASLHTNRLITAAEPEERMSFWVERESINTALHSIEPSIRLLEFGDGFLNWSFEFPVRHGFVYAGDKQSLIALREHRLLRDASADGFQVFSSYEYLNVPPGAEAWGSEEIRGFLEASVLDQRIKSELNAFDFEMLHIHWPHGIPFIRFSPKDKMTWYK